MLRFPDINPDIAKFSLFGLNLQVRWYGFFYVLSFILAYIFYRKNLKLRGIELKNDLYESVIFYVMLGVILGGRLGYVIFYNFAYYFHHPFGVFAVWEGGMSFHGGILGVITAGLLFARKHKYSFYSLADPAIPLAAMGLGLGRLGNFINAELYGKPTSLPWGMIFPNSDGVPRHPTQLYELFLEGIVLALVCQFLLKKVRKEGLVFWAFVGMYGVFRFMIEFVREPDSLDFYTTYGFIFGFMPIGQFLSLLMIIAATIGIFLIYREKPTIATIE